MIVQTPDKILTTKAKIVKKIDKKISGVVDRMKKIILSANKPKGVGLAAPQIGVCLQIFITKPTSNSDIEVFINPEIIWKSDKMMEIQRPESEKRSPGKDKKLEGCLSINNVWGYLKRPHKVRLRFLDMKGQMIERKYEGFMATIVQHETDHLNGILFTQRVLEQKEKLYRLEEDEKGEEKLVEINV